MDDRVSCAFWEEPEARRHEAIVENVTRIVTRDQSRHMNDLLHASLYGNVEKFGFTPRSYNRPAARAHARLSLNVVRNMISTVTSKIAAKNKVSPKFLTDGGSYTLQQRAKGMEKLVGGIFDDQKFYRKQRIVFREMGIFGTGFVRPWADHATRTVTIERVPQSDIIVDPEEARYGDPRSLYHRKFYDKRVLAKMFPGKQDIIDSAGKRFLDSMEPVLSETATADVIPVFEAFHRPSAPGAEDGMRCVCVDTGVLGSEEWSFDYFPFPKIVWSEEPDGFFGTGIAYELAGIQAEINDVLLELARAHRLIKGFWAVDNNARVNVRHINDDLGKIIKFAGVVPQYITPNAIPGDVYRYLWDLYAKAYEIVGVSQLSATGQKPAGLNSGEAQRVHNDIQTERFLEVGLALEDWTVDVADQCIDRARELAKEGGFKVRAVAGKGTETIEFSAVELERDAYRIQVFPASMLPNTPSGRLATVNDLMQGGLIEDPGAALELLGYPDTEAFTRRKNAPRELLNNNMEKILDKGHWVSPEPLDDHDLALAEVPLAIADARNRGVSADRLSMARRYVVLSARLQALATTPDGLADAVTSADPNAAPPPSGPPPGPEPPTAPGAPPGPMPMAA